MSRLAKSLIVLFSVMSPQTALGSEEAPSRAALICQVSGYDLLVVNSSDKSLRAGTSLHWSVPFARMQGRHALRQDLQPGGRAFLAGVLGSNHLDGRQSCTVRVKDDDGPIP